MDHTAPSWALSVSIRLPEARSYSCSFPVWEERHTRGQISPSAFKTHFRNTLWSVNHICKQTWASEARKVSQEWQREKQLKADKRQNVRATRGEIPAVTRPCWQARRALAPFVGSGLDTHFYRAPAEPCQALTALSTRALLTPISKTASFIRWLLYTDAKVVVSIRDFPKLSPAVHVKPQKLHRVWEQSRTSLWQRYFYTWNRVMQCIFCKATLSGVQKDTIYLGANDDLPISWDKERAECILTIHCPDTLQGWSVNKGRAQNLLSLTKSGPPNET